MLVVLFVLGACAPAAPPPAAPAPAPPAAPAAPGAPEAPPLPPTETLTEAPDDWWLLDPTVDGFPGTSVERTYRELLADRQPQREVVVAIIDSGVDIDHVDLAGVLWVNDAEIPGNALDDDGNGYVDDVHGWNFIGGSDGRHVDEDTYEVTRLYAGCRERGELETPACEAVAADFESNRAEAVDILQQYNGIAATQEYILGVLRGALGTDSLTEETVADLQPTRPEVVQARQIYLQMMELGATPEIIEEGIEALTTRVEYGYNPDFDPRHIVGDDYSDPTERYYGNEDVFGPSAEHGTHVAGIVAADRSNATGVSGVSNAARIMVVRTVPDGDERDKDVANAIRYAVDNGAQIINMSFGKGYSPEKSVVDDAVRHAEANGVLLIHAAGNAGENLDGEPNFPNRYYEDGGEAELWIEVGASGWRGVEGLAAPFSNYSASRVDVFAPGVDIMSTVPDGEYRANQGTSMAAPVVSGIAALLLSYFPDLTPLQVRELILDSALRYSSAMVPIPGGAGDLGAFRDLSATGGIVNAYEAVSRALEISGY